MVSNVDMRRFIPGFWFLLLTGSSLWAQPQSADKAQQAAIQRVKSTLVSSLDSGSPKVSLEFFLSMKREEHRLNGR